ncbi:MAG: hypothetical protein IKE69_01400 [Thermoguttaceae bacterium]|nr:hypothetical protein [Thermoguttaceae bacterium]
MLLLAPFILITSCFKLACTNESQVRTVMAVPGLEASAEPSGASFR